MLYPCAPASVNSLVEYSALSSILLGSTAAGALDAMVASLQGYTTRHDFSVDTLFQLQVLACIACTAEFMHAQAHWAALQDLCQQSLLHAPSLYACFCE
jgi:hypothetical protein